MALPHMANERTQSIWQSKNRIAQDAPHYRQHDFLKGGPELYVDQEINDSLGRSSSSLTKFKRGFNRRNHDYINPEEDRLAYEEMKYHKRQAARVGRHENLSKLSCKYGNVINSSDGQPEIPRSKKFLRGPDSEALNRQRQANGASRYHIVPTDADRQRAVKKLEEYERRQVQHSSIIQVGKRDLPSVGTWDNFVGGNVKSNCREPQLPDSLDLLAQQTASP